MVDAGSEPTYAEKIRVPPLGSGSALFAEALKGVSIGKGLKMYSHMKCMCSYLVRLKV